MDGGVVGGREAASGGSGGGGGGSGTDDGLLIPQVFGPRGTPKGAFRSVSPIPVTQHHVPVPASASMFAPASASGCHTRVAAAMTGPLSFGPTPGHPSPPRFADRAGKAE